MTPDRSVTVCLRRHGAENICAELRIGTMLVAEIRAPVFTRKFCDEMFFLFSAVNGNGKMWGERLSIDYEDGGISVELIGDDTQVFKVDPRAEVGA